MHVFFQMRFSYSCAAGDKISTDTERRRSFGDSWVSSDFCSRNCNPRWVGNDGKWRVIWAENAAACRPLWYIDTASLLLLLLLFLVALMMMLMQCRLNNPPMWLRSASAASAGHAIYKHLLILVSQQHDSVIEDELRGPVVTSRTIPSDRSAVGDCAHVKKSLSSWWRSLRSARDKSAHVPIHPRVYYYYKIKRVIDNRITEFRRRASALETTSNCISWSGSTAAFVLCYPHTRRISWKTTKCVAQETEG